MRHELELWHKAVIVLGCCADWLESLVGWIMLKGWDNE